MKTVYYVRHGLSHSNVKGLVSGAEDDVELTDEGRDQAKLAGQDLKSKPIDAVVCSPLKRTVETAQIIAREIGFPVDKIKTNKDFIERYVGSMTGRPHQEYREAIHAGTLPADTETREAMKERIQRGFETIKEMPEEHILLVSHGGAGRIIKILNEGLHLDDMYKIDDIKNTEIYEFTL